jgi:hypothetical protein
MYEAGSQLNEAEERCPERWPCPLVAWRNYSHIGGSEIERAREEFLALPGADPEKIEQEYRSVKADERAKEQALEDWYARNGMAKLKAEADRATKFQEAAHLAVLTTRPTTIAGVAAVLDYVATHSGERAEADGTDIFNWNHKTISEACDGFYHHLADSLRSIGGVS